jgi:formylglycine-generating enzyme required for sulfatase activity
LLFALGFIPSLAGPGYLSSLAAGLVLPPLVAILAGWVAARGTDSPERLYLVALRLGLLAVLGAVIALALQGMRVGMCEPGRDWLLFALGPATGILAAGVWGAVAGSVASVIAPNRRGLVAVLLAWLGPAGAVGMGLGRFYSSPMVYAFDPFIGFFAGTPYDTGFDPTARLLSYRLGTLAWLLAAFAGSRLLTRTATGRLEVRRPIDLPIAGIGLLSVIFAGGIAVTGKSLGHYSTAESIRERLGHSIADGRCEVVFSGAIPRPAAQRMASDCSAWLEVLESRLGVPKLPKVTAYVFADVGEKEAAMGAGHTQVAKPWRREIYINGAEYPHPTIGHELAHVMAGQTGRGPFKIAGKLGGWLPNVGLIEGLAVALAPDEDDDLSAEQWAQALNDLHRLPPLQSLFALDFLVQPGRLAYLVAGAFVEWVERKQGAATLRRWYRGESLEAITGQSMERLEADWHQDLGKIALPQAAQEAARSLFARKSALVRHCPHAVDRAFGTAIDALNGQDPQRACQIADATLKLDRDDLRFYQIAAECRHRSGDERGAEDRWRGILADEQRARPERDQALEALADRALEHGDLESARRSYRKIIERTLEIDRRRTLEVKADVGTPEGIAAIEALITGGAEGANWDRGSVRLAEWMTAAPDDGLPRYLLGRGMYNHGQLGEAQRLMSEALSRRLSPASVKSEARRLQLILACASRDQDLVRQVLPEIAADETMPLARRRGAAALAARCLGVRGPALTSNEGSVPSSQPPKMDIPKSASVQSELSCPEGMELIPAGETWIGANPHIYSPEEGPRFKTRLAPFCLDRTEVTMGAWKACVDSGHCDSPGKGAATCNGRYSDRDRHPVNCVNYKQAEAYCASRGARLPTEFEWEYAAHGGEKGLKYPWGDAPPDGHTCWKQPGTCPVASYPAGAFGLFDMSGNVWEWTSSDFGPYPFPPLPGTSSLKVYRGGSWSRRFEKWMHLGLRNRFGPGQSGSHLGLRCAESPKNAGCAFERDADGNCLQGVLDMECEAGQTFNGLRCAKTGQPLCLEGTHPEPGYGCVRDVRVDIKWHALDLSKVNRQRSSEFDGDCRKNQPPRPMAYRLSGGEHLARNAVAQRDKCKNRDVGVGWNSVCCAY